MNWSLRPATLADVEPLAEIRAAVLRDDLTRLGRYDEHRVRQRLRDTFAPGLTSIIEVGGAMAGSITLRPAADRHWLEHFYLAGVHQGQGLGTAVLSATLARTDALRATVGLTVLQGSKARHLYERHGFAYESEDPVDVTLCRTAR